MTNFSSGEQYFDNSFKKLELPEKSDANIEFEDYHFSYCDFSEAGFRGC